MEVIASGVQELVFHVHFHTKSCKVWCGGTKPLLISANSYSIKSCQPPRLVLLFSVRSSPSNLLQKGRTLARPRSCSPGNIAVVPVVAGSGANLLAGSEAALGLTLTLRHGSLSLTQQDPPDPDLAGHPSPPWLPPHESPRFGCSSKPTRASTRNQYKRGEPLLTPPSR